MLKQSTEYDTTFSQARTICHALHDKDANFGLTFMKRDPETKDITAVEHSFGTFTEQESTLAKNAMAGWEPYVITACTNAKGHAKSLVTESRAVAADFDDGLPELFESNELIRPSFVVTTSPGRFHAVWILDAACTPAQMLFLATVIQDRFGSDPAFARINQMIRLPGFINHKNRHRVRLVEPVLSHRLHSYDLLCQAFDAPLVVNLQRKINHRLDENLTISRHHHSTDDMVEDAKSALAYLVSWSDDYDTWIKIGLYLSALGESGRTLFHEFSSQSKKYDQDETDKKWNSFLQCGDSSSLKPLFYAAQRAGWKNPGYRNQESSSINVLTDRQFGAMCANAMQDEFAVIESQNVKGVPQFMKLDDGRYRFLSDIDKRSEVERECKAVLATLSSNNADVGLKATWLKKIGTNKGLNDVCEHIAEVLIQTHQGNKVKSFPYFPLGKGVLNLLSRELVPERYRPLPTFSTTVLFDSMATAPLFTRVLNDIFENDEEVVSFVLRMFGLILLGRPEQFFFVWYGPTANNGKSLLVKVLKSILGQYFTFLPTASLMIKSHTSDGANPAIAQLAGKRLAVVSEPTGKQALDASLIKQLTGDGHINVRDNYGTPKDMAVEAMLLMVTNYMPSARDDDHGLWRRTIVVPFNRTFTLDESDEQLPGKLAKEGPGILNMMLDGAHDYLLNGLNPPDKIRMAVLQQRQEADPFEAFSADCLLKSAGSTCGLKEIYAAYLDWNKQNQKFRRLTKPELSKWLEKQYEKRKSGHLPVFDGIDVINS